MTSMESFHGHVKTQLDAIILFEACQLGLIPRIRRRLSERERLQIQSGCVYIWDEREAGMRRWTDGKSWSASRVSGSFLTYREMDTSKKIGGNALKDENVAASRKRKNSEPHNNRKDDGNTSDDSQDVSSPSCRYKQNGLYKQSFSLTTSNNLKLHLISYYKKEDLPNLVQPSNEDRLKNINLPLERYPDTSHAGSNLVPAITTTPLYSGVPPAQMHPHNNAISSLPPLGNQGLPTALPFPSASHYYNTQLTPQQHSELLHQQTTSLLSQYQNIPPMNPNPYYSHSRSLPIPAVTPSSSSSTPKTGSPVLLPSLKSMAPMSGDNNGISSSFITRSPTSANEVYRLPSPSALTNLCLAATTVSAPPVTSKAPSVATTASQKGSVLSLASLCQAATKTTLPSSTSSVSGLSGSNSLVAVAARSNKDAQAQLV